MTVNEFLTKTRCAKPSGELRVRPRVECTDGFTICIQASGLHYCTPQTNKEGTVYQRIELGYPSESDDIILPFAEDPDNPIGTVYPQVPVTLVDELLKKHGGIA